MPLIENEQVKLTATWLNSVASGILVTGVVAPAVAAFYGVAGSAQLRPVAIAAGSAAWLVVAAILDFLARAILRRLRS